jgi:hypothetical protein
VGKHDWADALEQCLAKAERCQSLQDVVLDCGSGWSRPRKTKLRPDYPETIRLLMKKKSAGPPAAQMVGPAPLSTIGDRNAHVSGLQAHWRRFVQFRRETYRYDRRYW